MVRAISVVIPARDESDRLSATLRSFIQNRRSGVPVEFVIVDDGSADGCCLNFIPEARALSQLPRVSVSLCGLSDPRGNYVARNAGAGQARGDILFITDAHVGVLPGWDELVIEVMSPESINAATICTPSQGWAAYGCRLVYPDMGTRWNRKAPLPGSRVAIAPCSGTVLTRELFCELGGYDPGMRDYFGGEPEFSVRAWILGADVRCLPQLRVLHRFKAHSEYSSYVRRVRPMMIYNAIRFASLYLSEARINEVRDYYMRAYPAQTAIAVGWLRPEEIERRRNIIERRAVRNFEWFARHYPVIGLK
jgi:glycosyltransferase involved in cell wall biosynthesis